MQWECMTSKELGVAAKKNGVCIIAMGVLEKHSEHLPLGTDYLNAHRLACLAAEKEAAIVFPPFYFGQIYEARCFPGAVTLKPTLLIDLIQSVFDEIGRNGFKKIIVQNGHGGNDFFLKFLAQSALWEEKPYSLYVQTEWLNAARQKKWKALLQTELHGHACECETSVLMANYPELVNKKNIPKQPSKTLNRVKHIPGSFMGITWYASYPEHYCGDARLASAEKGHKLQQLLVDQLAEFIAAVKQDKIVPALEQEFYKRVNSLRK
ncbi:MAG: creatininase family protein [bacterium]